MRYDTDSPVLEDYQNWWKSQNIFWRFWNTLQWRFGNLIAAIFGGMTPGEYLLLDALEHERLEVLKYHQIFDVAATKLKPHWQKMLEELDEEVGDDDPTIPIVIDPPSSTVDTEVPKGVWH